MYSKKNKNLKKLALNLTSNNNTMENIVPPPSTPLNNNNNNSNNNALATGIKSSNNHDNKNIMQHQTNDIYKQGPAYILPNLYLGAYYNASNISQLNQLNIDCIINVASEVNISTQLEYHHIHWKHCQNNLATTEFTKAISKIELALKKGQTILVHCQQGIERSAALIIAYILYLSHQKINDINYHQQQSNKKDSIKGQQWSLDHALKYVQERAPGIRPNMELLYQLREYDKSISLLSSVTPAKKHNIQTRTRRSESIASCSTSNNHTKLSISTSKSSLKYQNRPRSASLKESSLSSLTQHHQKTNTITLSSPSTPCRQKLATAVLLVVLTTAVLYQQRKVIYSFQGEENSNNIQHYRYVDSFFMKPVSIY